MATLNIGGVKVKVDDSFLSLTPEQQAATVEEIASSLPSMGASQEYSDALSAGSAASQFFDREPVQQPPSLMGSTAATLGGLVNGIPVVGPAIQGLSDGIIGTGVAIMGGDGRATVQSLRDRREKVARANPVANIAGQLSAPLGVFGAAAKAPTVAAALGLTGPLTTQITNGAVANALLTSADSLVRGEDTTQGAVMGGATGAAGPLVGRALETAGRAIGDRMGPIISGALDPMREAQRRVGVAMGRDRSAGNAMAAADEPIAQAAGIPLTNVDRGGEVSRALARSVANQNPEARATLTSLAQDRYKSQSGRAVDVINRITGGKVDDLGYLEKLTASSRAQNSVNYKRAEASPKAQSIFTVETQELMQSPAVQRAIDMAESRGKDYAAIAGDMPVVNPFKKGSDGRWRVVQKADGTFTAPSLAFWDQVKRNLDGMIGVAQRTGDNTEVMVLKQIKDKLVQSLDSVVPEYAAARAGAAAAFGAEDALEAGKLFARQPGQIPEAKRAFANFKPADREAFSIGYASELIDRIKVRGDSQNVIKATFESPAAREMNELVFGPAGAKELEAYVRVEAIADQLRNALGNSTTARQLVELGIGGGAGFALSGDWQGALTGAALTRAGRYAGEKVDARVMEQVAKLLTTGTRKDLDIAVKNAAQSEEWLKALKAIGQTLQVGVMTSSLAQTE